MYPFTMGWDIFGTMIREYFLSYSPEYKPTRTIHPLTIPSISKYIKLQRGDVISTYHWQALTGKNMVELTFKIFNPMNPDIDDPFSPQCLTHLRQRSSEQCFTTSKILLSYNSLPFMPLTIPKTPLEAQILTRYLNSQVTVLGHDQKPLWGQKQIFDTLYIEVNRWNSTR